MKLNALYIIDRKDEIDSLRLDHKSYQMRLDLAIDGREQLGASNIRLELECTKKFENMLHDKIQEVLKLELGIQILL
jgi:hypothetical protein